MIKAKEVSVKNIVVFMVFALAVTAGYYLTRPRVTTPKSVPVFMGEEIVVNRAIKADKAFMIEKAVRVERALKVERAINVQTAPMPKFVAPLPIVPPSITFKVLPAYPSTALEKNLQGMVLLSVYVGLSGQPERIETRTSSGIAELDDSAARAVSQWKFAPATQGGAALSSWFEVPVRFELK